MTHLLSLLVFLSLVPPTVPPGDSLYSAPVAHLHVQASELGEGWMELESTLIEDFNVPPDTSDAGSALQFRMMKKLLPRVGIDGYAEWKYGQATESDVVVLAVQVLRFSTQSDAVAWWTKKHNPKREGRDYTRVEGVGDAAVDAAVLRAMRYVRVGNVVLRATEARAVLAPWEPSGIHRDVLRRLAERIRDTLIAEPLPR